MDKVKQIYIGHNSLITSLGDKIQTFAALEEKKCGLAYNEEYKMIVGSINKNLHWHLHKRDVHSLNRW